MHTLISNLDYLNSQLFERFFLVQASSDNLIVISLPKQCQILLGDINHILHGQCKKIVVSAFLHDELAIHNGVVEFRLIRIFAADRKMCLPYFMHSAVICLSAGAC